jgi:hypothetical protein
MPCQQPNQPQVNHTTINTIAFMNKRIYPKDNTNFVAKGRFQFMTEAFIRENYIQFTSFQSKSLRSKLPRGIYWLQITSGGIIQWNWTILQDYLINGDRPEHQALVEEYLATLPKAA